MTTYNIYIETRKFVGGKVRSKICEEGVPVRMDMVAPAYQEIYKRIIESHKQAIKGGRLEKITTRFESEIRVIAF
jgi:hypothetical protein